MKKLLSITLSFLFVFALSFAFLSPATAADSNDGERAASSGEWFDGEECCRSGGCAVVTPR